MTNKIVPSNILLERAQSQNQIYKNSKPFPHIVIDDFFDEDLLIKVLDEFPNMDEKWAVEWKLRNELKSLTKGEERFEENTITLLRFLNSEPFLLFLEELTGIKNLIPDPHYNGGGFHQIKRGGYLKIHADFNKHPDTKLDRRLNVLLYLNQDWKEEYGGHFELWNKDMTKAEAKILPLFNRLVVFTTTSESYHGHPDPLLCPENMVRKSIALYYYTNGRPEEEVIDGNEVHDTIFKDRKKEVYDESFKKDILKEKIKQFIPPILIKLLKRR